MVCNLYLAVSAVEIDACTRKRVNFSSSRQLRGKFHVTDDVAGCQLALVDGIEKYLAGNTSLRNVRIGNIYI
jgi:hypothetical protein